jgi:hypothetical protein
MQAYAGRDDSKPPQPLKRRVAGTAGWIKGTENIVLGDEGKLGDHEDKSSRQVISPSLYPTQVQSSSASSHARRQQQTADRH